MTKNSFSWQDPLTVAAQFADEETIAFLYSGMRMPFTGRYSYLGLNPRREIKAESFEPFAGVLTKDQPPLANAWFGYLGYGLRHTLERVPSDPPGPISLPVLWMAQYRTIMVFDHEQRSIDVWGEPFKSLQANVSDNEMVIGNVSSNMTKAEYLAKAAALKEAIFAGEIYQANLTRKFWVNIRNHNPWHLFLRLCQASPAPYATYLKFGDTHILSSSPESFLSIDNKGKITTRPIKGTAPLEESPEAFSAHEKDRAENLMIVDLMRNDLSRVCIPGSVNVERLFDVDSYATLQQMSSTVSGIKQPGVTALDVVKACFPPGSMTGTPKIKAMEWCSRMEQMERGVYSGALGWFGGDGSADLSVVIRTIILQNDLLEFQVGGAIVADSDPEAEWRETMLKAIGIARALGLDMMEFETL